MLFSNLKLKIAVLLSVLLVLHFVQNYYLKGAFVEKGVEQAITPSPLKNLTFTVMPALSISELFGLYKQEKKPEPQKTEELEQLFDNSNKEFIGQIGNYQFILYATAEVGGKLTAKLLVKDLDTNNVVLLTAKRGDFIANASVTYLALSELRMSSIGEKMTLKLFSKRTPPPVATK